MINNKNYNLSDEDTFRNLKNKKTNLTLAVEPVLPAIRCSSRADSSEYNGSICFSLQNTSRNTAGVLL